jgi:hypothetical protein
MDSALAALLDPRGRVIRWPSKLAQRQAVLAYLAERFETGIEYSEREVNDVILDWTTFGDFSLLRRELCAERHLARTTDGSKYWLSG